MTEDKIKELKSYLELVESTKNPDYPDDIYGQSGGNFDDAYADGRSDGFEDGVISLASSLLIRFFNED